MNYISILNADMTIWSAEIITMMQHLVHQNGRFSFGGEPTLYVLFVFFSVK
jgi:hypothetical protein